MPKAPRAGGDEPSFYNRRYLRTNPTTKEWKNENEIKHK